MSAHYGDLQLYDHLSYKAAVIWALSTYMRRYSRKQITSAAEDLLCDLKID